MPWHFVIVVYLCVVWIFSLSCRCIPFRYRANNDETSDDKHDKLVEVLMINSQSGPGLLFPKVLYCDISIWNIHAIIRIQSGMFQACFFPIASYLHGLQTCSVLKFSCNYIGTLIPSEQCSQVPVCRPSEI